MQIEWFTKAAPGRLRDSLWTLTSGATLIHDSANEGFITMYFALTSELVHGTTVIIHFYFLCLFCACFAVAWFWISLWEYWIFYNAKRSRSTRIWLRSEYELYPLRRPYHRFRQRSLKPSKWVRNRQSSVRNQTSANGDDTSRYRYRYTIRCCVFGPER